MQSPKLKVAHVILRQELRGLSGVTALWGMLTILSLLLGYSFMQAINLFSQASQTALTYPALAVGLNPLEGIFVPTFGAYYLVETLLLPFIIIRLTGQDKQNGTLKLLLQLPLTPTSLNLFKLVAMISVWLLILVPGISSIFIWHGLGGTTYLPEILCLLLGHSLYTLTIITIAMFATAISDSLPTAAMICLAATLGSWVLDFAANSGSGFALLGSWSFTTQLRQFENGLLSTNSIVYFLGLALFFFIGTSVWIHPGRSRQYKLKVLSCSALLLVIIISGIMQWPNYLDVTENHKHSFNPADTRALKMMQKPLIITIHLTREDGRYYDFKHEILTKLHRVVPHLQVVFSKTQSSGLFGATDDESYGLIEYDYAGRHAQSYSNSTQEILPLLHALAGQRIKPNATPEYSGHPLVTDASIFQWWFYLILPLGFIFAAWKTRR